jgi:hypothetical protein
MNARIALMTGIAIGALVTLSLATSGPTPAASAPRAALGAPAVLTLSLTPAAFRSTDSRRDDAAGACGTLGLNPALSFESIAPVNLPDGAVIVGFQAIASDDFPPASLLVRLIEVGDTCGTTVISQLTTAGLSDSLLTLEESGLAHAVDNTTNGYMVVAQWTVGGASEILLRNVRVRYTVAPVAAACDGDINGDRSVDGADLSVLLAQFGNVCAP